MNQRYKAALNERIEEVQRQESRQAWHEHCTNYGEEGNKDPNRYATSFLESFIQIYNATPHRTNPKSAAERKANTTRKHFQQSTPLDHLPLGSLAKMVEQTTQTRQSMQQWIHYIDRNTRNTITGDKQNPRSHSRLSLATFLTTHSNNQGHFISKHFTWKCDNGFYNNPIDLFCGGSGPLGCKKKQKRISVD